MEVTHNGAFNHGAVVPAPPVEVQVVPVTKAFVRQRVWEFMEKNDIAVFPRPVYNRIPNFKGAPVAGQKVATLPEFLSARTIKVSPDKPQEEVRFQVLQASKDLIVPTPGLAKGLFNRLSAEPGSTKERLRQLASRQGIDELSKPVPMASRLKIDLVVVGSVAVDITGRRIGKGEGFTDLEFAMAASHHAAVTNETVIVTTVHDVQVFDDDLLPQHLFSANDVTVDIIVTPTRIIRVEKPLPKPDRIFWNLLTKEKFEKVPILKEIQFREKKTGKDVRLRDEVNTNNGNNSNEVVASFEDNNFHGLNNHKPVNHNNGNKKPKSKKMFPTKEAESGAHQTHLKKDVNGGSHPNGNRKAPSPKAASPETSAVDASEALPVQHTELKSNGANSNETHRPSSNGNKTPKINKRQQQNGNHNIRSNQNNAELGMVKQAGIQARPHQNNLENVVIFFIGRIPRTARVKDLKDALILDRKLPVLDLVWKGSKGIAFAYVELKSGKTEEELLAELQDLKIGDVLLNVELDRRQKRVSGDGQEKSSPQLSNKQQLQQQQQQQQQNLQKQQHNGKKESGEYRSKNSKRRDFVKKKVPHASHVVSNPVETEVKSPDQPGEPNLTGNASKSNGCHYCSPLPEKKKVDATEKPEMKPSVNA